MECLTAAPMAGAGPCQMPRRAARWSPWSTPPEGEGPEMTAVLQRLTQIRREEVAPVLASARPPSSWRGGLLSHTLAVSASPPPPSLGRRSSPIHPRLPPAVAIMLLFARVLSRTRSQRLTACETVLQSSTRSATFFARSAPPPAHAPQPQWERLAPLLPPQRPRTARPARDRRTVLSAILWVLRTGAP